MGHLTRFGLSSLKSFQLDAVNAVESKKDTVVIQPTGSGKSLCYQLPALFDSSTYSVRMARGRRWSKMDRMYPR